MTLKRPTVLLLGCNLTVACASAPRRDVSGLTGRWNGPWGPDNIREVLILTQNSPTVVAGTSAFETREGVTLPYGRGVVNGTLSGSRLEFTLARDKLTFSWSGTIDNNGLKLTGTFSGYSTDATYVKQ